MNEPQTERKLLTRQEREAARADLASMTGGEWTAWSQSPYTAQIETNAEALGEFHGMEAVANAGAVVRMRNRQAATLDTIDALEARVAELEAALVTAATEISTARSICHDAWEADMISPDGTEWEEHERLFQDAQHKALAVARKGGAA